MARQWKKDVLVIDDDDDMRHEIRCVLSEAGFDIIEARSGREAIHYLTSDAPEPSLIVTDLAMPDMTGWELIDVLQAYTRLSSIPVLVLSGRRLAENPVRHEGVVELFKKPLDPEAFVAAALRHSTPPEQREARRHAASRELTGSRF